MINIWFMETWGLLTYLPDIKKLQELSIGGLSLYCDHLYDKANILFWNEGKLQPLIQQITNKYIIIKEIKERIYCYMIRIGLEELYNTVILEDVGYDIGWVANRLKQIIDKY